MEHNEAGNAVILFFYYIWKHFSLVDILAYFVSFAEMRFIYRYIYIYIYTYIR